MGLNAMVRCGCRNACPHQHGTLASVHVSNWPDYRLFQQALRDAGRHHFPVLCAELPDSGGGALPPDHACAALAELRYFAERADLGTQTWLVDDDTGATVIAAVPSYAGIFIWAGRSRHKIGADPDGFFVREAGRDERDVFRSSHFTQTPTADGRVLFTDLDTRATASVALREPVGHTDDHHFPHRLRVDTVLVQAQDFADVIAALTAILHTAGATDRPVLWS